jgi:hypothetical protein
MKTAETVQPLIPSEASAFVPQDLGTCLTAGVGARRGAWVRAEANQHRSLP